MTIKVDGTNGVLQAYDYQVLTTGFSYTFAAGVQVLLAVPAGTLATGTVTMPASPADGMNITITSTQEITALTVNANTGQSIVGGGASYLPANGSRTFIYRLSNTTWYPQAVAIPQPLTDIQTFNAGGSTTFTKPTGGQTMARIQVWGGGGGGGRAAATSGAAGGGGGGYNEVTVPIAYIDSQTVTIGAAGVGRTGSTGTGTAGGFSSVAINATGQAAGIRATIQAYGGGGGSIYGGTGGGQLSAGITPNSNASFPGGQPYMLTTINSDTDAVSTVTNTAISVGGSYQKMPLSGSMWHGGAGAPDSNTTFPPFNGATVLTNPAGSTYYGGGGGFGGSSAAQTGFGESMYGGNGGYRAAGSAPAGGGGGGNSTNGNGYDGGAGRIIITCY